MHIEAMGYELPPVVVTSAELEGRLAPMYEKLRISAGQLELMTGIMERRWWTEGSVLSDGAAAAAKKALAKSGVKAAEIETLIYAGVCRENFEPATACAVAAKVGVAPNAFVYDISNACLGVLNGIIDIANRIELGQIKAGMVVSCETAREINELTIRRMLANPTMGMFTQGRATLTGGSGAVAVILVHESLMKGGAEVAGGRGACGAGASCVVPVGERAGEGADGAGGGGVYGDGFDFGVDSPSGVGEADVAGFDADAGMVAVASG